MHIAYAVQRAPPAHLTGSDLYVYEIAQALPKTTRSTIYAIGDRPPPPPGGPDLGSARLETFPGRWPRYAALGSRFLLDRYHLTVVRQLIAREDEGFYYSLLYGPYSAAMEKALTGAKVDLLHSVAIPSPAVWTAWKVARSRRLPLVINPFLHLAGVETRLPFVLRMLRDASALIAATELERQFVMRQGVAPDRVHVMPPAFVLDDRGKGDRGRFRERHAIPASSFVALIPRKAELKGTFHAMEALGRLQDRRPGVVVVLTGYDPPYVRQLVSEHSARLLQRGAKVLDLGYLPDQEYRDALAACDVLVEPSCVESFGRVYLDAWQESKPVIAARSGAVPEVVQDHVQGLLVEFGDVAGIDRALTELREVPGLGPELGARGRQCLVERYDLATLVRRHEALYRTLVGG